MLTIAMQAMLQDDTVMYADTPVHLTHTAFFSEPHLKDLSPIGKQPYRFLAMAVPDSNLTVGVLADLYTRLDLGYKAVAGSQVANLLGGQKPSVVEIQTPPYCVRWTFSLSLEDSVREFTNSKDPEGYTRLFNALAQQLPAYVRGDFKEEEQGFECQYVTIREHKACLFRVKATKQHPKFDHRQELHALFLDQKPDLNLQSTELAVKAFFNYLCK